MNFPLRVKLLRIYRHISPAFFDDFFLLKVRKMADIAKYILRFQQIFQEFFDKSKLRKYRNITTFSADV